MTSSYFDGPAGDDLLREGSATQAQAAINRAHDAQALRFLALADYLETLAATFSNPRTSRMYGTLLDELLCHSMWFAEVPRPDTYALAAWVNGKAERKEILVSAITWAESNTEDQS